MSSVIKKKKKTMLGKILNKIKVKPLPSEQEGINNNVPLADIRIDSGEIATIALKRDELKTAKQNNSNAMVTFNDRE
jgi:hypothetical protein